MGTIAQTMHAEGKAEGLAEGLAEGKATTLLRLLQRRFGPVPRRLRDRIAAADVGQVDAWLDAVLDAPSLSAVFDPNIPH